MNSAIKNKNKKIRRSFAIPMAVLLAFGAMGAPSAAPAAMAAKAAEQPGSVESLFKLSNDWGLNQAADKGLVTKTNQSVTKNGVTITVKEVMFDEAQLTIGYVKHVAKGQEDRSFIPVISYGDKMHTPGFESSVDIDDQTTAYFLKFTNMGQFPDQFDVKLQEVRSPDQTKAEWELSIPVKKIMKGTTVLKPMTTKSSGDTSYTVKEIAITPSRTAIKFELKYPKYMEDGRYFPSMKLEDETGTIYEGYPSFINWKSTDDGYSRECVYLFSPFQTVPKSMKIGFVHEKLLMLHEAKPEIFEVAVEHKPTTEKPIVLKRSKSGLVKITDIRYEKDKTEVRFQTEGPDPYRVSLELIADGKEWYASPKLVDPKTYTFVTKFPALPSDAKIKFASSEVHETKYVPELAMTIPVKP
ncbi:DUF4179 domain-containing protein [Paenibacillus oleatilyticus]|uniref:DUF4179 domain-containing protein n=1 Tax=Paenibacillus oleatilyticus TaxID=2594886 RepID=A0ABV4UZ63_9BACL